MTRRPTQQPREKRPASAEPVVAAKHAHGDHAAILALQRSAGNAAVARMLHRWPMKIPDLSGYVPVDPGVEREWTAELRRQAGNRMDKAFVKYAQAVQTIKEEMAAKKARPSLIAELVAVALGALAPGLSGMVVARLKAGLRPVAEAAIQNFGEQTALAAEQIVDHYLMPRHADGDRRRQGVLRDGDRTGRSGRLGAGALRLSATRRRGADRRRPPPRPSRRRDRRAASCCSRSRNSSRSTSRDWTRCSARWTGRRCWASGRRSTRRA